MDKDTTTTTKEQKQEMVLKTYRTLWDLDAAYAKNKLTPEEITEFNDDESFQSRIRFYEVSQKEEIIQNLIDLASSSNEKIALSATLELGKVVYPEKFNLKPLSGKGEEDVKYPPITINIAEERKKVEEQKENAEEVLRILCESGAFESGTEEPADSKIQ